MKSSKLKIQRGLVAAVLVAVMAGPAYAGSCCGGGSGGSIILSKEARVMLDVSNSVEIYDGFWDQSGNWIADPKGSDLKQYRNTLGVGYRFADRWQGSISLPYVWNRNSYAGGLTANSSGVGDTSMSLWYESFDNAMCVFKVRDIADLRPAIYWGLSLTAPTGTSPYDDVDDNFKITGRGFYQAGINVLIDKTVYPWTASVQLGYARHISRPVNMDFGEHIEPYDKELGGRFNTSASLGYVYFFENMSELTTNLNYAYLAEGKATIDGVEDASSGLHKHSFGLSVSWTGAEKVWVVKGGWTHSIKADGWGENFPTTDAITLGASYAFK